MREFIVRCENNKFTLEGEIVHCKDCSHRIVTDWYKYVEGMACSVYDCDKGIINDNKDSDYCSCGECKAVTEETDTDPDEVVDFNNMISAGGRIRNHPLPINTVEKPDINTTEQGRSLCNTCKYSDRLQIEEPCFSCIAGHRNYEPVEQQKELCKGGDTE